MTLKQYKIIKMLAVIALGILGGRAIVWGNFVTPILSMAAITLGLQYLRRRVKEVMADERDRQIGGKAALAAIQIFSWVAVVTMFVLYAERSRSVELVRAASLLAYSVCFLLFTYSGAYWYLNRHEK